MPGRYDPITAREAYDRARSSLDRNMEAGGYTESVFVGLVGFEGDLNASATQAVIGERDAFADAFTALALEDGRDGRLGDGVVGGWVVLFLMLGEDGNAAIAIHEATGTAGGSVRVYGQDGQDADSTEEPKAGGLNVCRQSDVADWKVTSSEAADIARRQDAMKTAIAATPDGQFLYELTMNEGFLDGCGGEARGFWQVTYADLEAAADGKDTTGATVLIDAETGEVLEADATEVATTGTKVLVDMDWNYTNGVPSGPFGNDVKITDFEVPNGMLTMTAHFERLQAPLEVFATNGRIRGPADYFDQGAFTGDELTLVVNDPAPGTWNLWYFVEHTEPQGQHRLHVTVTAES